MRLKFSYELKLIGDKIDISIMNINGTEQFFSTTDACAKTYSELK